MEITESLVSLPGGDILFARLASNLLESGDLEEATKICERGVKKYPTYAQAHYILAKCYLKQKMNDQARAELERVLRYDANHINAIKDLAGLYFITGFHDLYRDYLLKLYTLAPLNKDVIHEVKKLGEYPRRSEEKPDETAEAVPDQAETESGMDDVLDFNEEVFLDTDSEASFTAGNMVSDKLDLSQYDNLEDDFTTILHGKLEFPGESQTKVLPEDDAEMFPELPAEEPEIITSTENQAQPGMDEDAGLDDIVDTTLMEETLDTHETTPHLESEVEEKGISSIETEAELPVPPEIKSEPEPVIPAKIEKIKKTPPPQAELIDDEEELPVSTKLKFDQPKIVSQTLGEILVSQKKYAEAKSVFEALKNKQPKNKSLDVKIAYLDKIIGLEKKSVR